MSSNPEPAPEPGGHSYYWSDMARRYHALQPPLRPSEADCEWFTRLASKRLHGEHPPRVLVLGATPAFYHLPWPDGTDLLAVDKSAPMLEAVWPGGAGQSRCQDWNHLDLPPASRDVALCDGSLSFFGSEDELAAFAGRLAGVMAPGGVFVARLFVPAPERSTPEQVMADLLAGGIGNISELKLRLWLALLEDPRAGIVLHDVWKACSAVIPDPAGVASQVEWLPEQWQGITAYRDMEDVYHFPTVERVTHAFAGSGAGFEPLDAVVPPGPCAEHLALVSFRRLS